MTVSCNCQDDGSGILGSLDENSFEEIFFGPTANSFRASLAKGKLPILTCARCAELRSVAATVAGCRLSVVKGTAKACGNDGCPLSVDKESSTTNSQQLTTGSASPKPPATQQPINLSTSPPSTTNSQQLTTGSASPKPSTTDIHQRTTNPALPKTPTTQQPINITTPSLPHRGMLLENTVACNLACPGCIRPAVAKIRKKTRLSLDDVLKVAELIQRLKLEKLFYLNRGEPFLSPDILEELKIIRELNPNVHIATSTNGMLLDTDAKREAALLMDEVIFSIDGCDQKSLQKYQRGGDFERMLHNLRNLVVYRDARGLNVPQIEWKYLLFNWNDRPRQIAKAIWLAAGSREPVDKLLNESCSGRGESLTTQQLINSSTSPALPEASSTDQPINLATDPALPSADVISFWPTNNPAYGISWRYRLGLLNHIGTKSWKGREVRLRQSPPPRDQRSEDRDRRT
jgi:pyruvate-formate lyase-activating enzyme